MRITVLLTVNANGSDKLKPFEIGSPEKPQSFENVRTLLTRHATNK